MYGDLGCYSARCDSLGETDWAGIVSSVLDFVGGQTGPGTKCPAIDPELIADMLARITPAQRDAWLALDTGKRQWSAAVLAGDAAQLSRMLANSDCVDQHPVTRRFFELLEEVTFTTPPTVQPPQITIRPPGGSAPPVTYLPGTVTPGYQTGGPLLEAGMGTAGVVVVGLLALAAWGQMQRPRTRR